MVVVTERAREELLKFKPDEEPQVSLRLYIETEGG